MPDFDRTAFFPSRTAAETIRSVAIKLANETDEILLFDLRARKFVTVACEELMRPLLRHGVGESLEEYKATIRQFFTHISDEICAEPYDGSDKSPVDVWTADMLRLVDVASEEWRGDLDESNTRIIYLPYGVINNLFDEVNYRMKDLAAMVYS